MCPSQLIQGEDVIIYQSLVLGRLFFQRQRREGVKKRRRKPVKTRKGRLQHVRPGVTEQDQVKILGGQFKTMCSSNVSDTCLMWLSVRKRFPSIWEYEPVSCQNMSSWRKLNWRQVFTTSRCFLVPPSLSSSSTSPPSSILQAPGLFPSHSIMWNIRQHIRLLKSVIRFSRRLRHMESKLRGQLQVFLRVDILLMWFTQRRINVTWLICRKTLRTLWGNDEYNADLNSSIKVQPLRSCVQVAFGLELTLLLYFHLYL